MTLKTRISLLTLVTILLVVITQITTNFLTQGLIEQRFEDTAIEGEAQLWRTILKNQMDNMESNSTALARDRETRKALKALDTAALTENIKTTYNLLSSSHIISGIKITDTQAKIIADVPDQKGIGNTNLLAQSALQDGKIHRGIIQNSNGQAAIAVAFPLFTRGQAIGTGIYIKTLDAAIATLKESSELDVVILNQEGQVSYATDLDLFKSIEIELPSLGESSVQTAKANSLAYLVKTQTIKDFTGTPRAYLTTIKDYTASYTTQSRFTWVSYLVSATIIIVMVLGTLWYMNRAFLKLHAVINVIRDIATGDLTPKLATNNANDETGQLTKVMGVMLDNLSTMVHEINRTTEQLNSSSNTLSNISLETNKSIEQQFSATEQVATAVNELSATAQEVAKNASDAAQAAKQANSEAQEGARVSEDLAKSIHAQVNEVTNVADSLNKLQQQTNKINEVMSVINGIAEQTNLLALNAAIEAARAGEQGRGFAVVADEVRTLANRTQNSTKEIDETILRLQENTDATVSSMQTALEQAKNTEGFVNETTERLNAIAESVDTISNMIIQIASATEEQTAVTEDINRNVSQITQTSELVSEGSKQTAAATENMIQLSQQLGALVQKFKI